jgi:hypothetical protein
LFLFLPYRYQAENERLSRARLPQARRAIVNGAVRGRKMLGKRNMNTAGQIAVTLAALVGFGRLADEGESHCLSGVLILAGLVGKVALSI